jgi:hypothetical protein
MFENIITECSGVVGVLFVQYRPLVASKAIISSSLHMATDRPHPMGSFEASSTARF